MQKKGVISGFTLIELSIVIVIIGLIVGGVLVGRDLIRGAEMRSQISQIDQTNAAIVAFRLKYNCLPGDCINATTFFNAATQPQQVTNGNGDGKIAGVPGIPNHNSTWFTVTENDGWDHLSAAQLVPLAQYDETATTWITPGVGYPQLKINSNGPVSAPVNQTNGQGGIMFGYETAISYNTGGHRIRLGACRTNDIVWGPNIFGFGCPLNEEDAFTLDTKIDDGKPFSGGMIITPEHYIYRIMGWTSNLGTDISEVNCGNYPTNRYVLSSNVRGCAPSIKAPY